MKLNKMFLVSILLLAILAISAVSASEDISDDVSAIEPADEVISDQIDDNLEETDPQEEILEEDGEVKSLTDFKSDVESNDLEPDLIEINLTNNYKYNPDTDENVTRVALAGEDYRFKTIILDGKGHSVDGGGKDLIMRLGYMMSNVTVKNIIFKNFNRTVEVSSGYRDFINVDARNGKLENLTLENISSSTSGYLIYLQGGFGDDDSYALENCVFKDNDKVKCFLEIARNNVQVNNCNFTNNDATYFISDDQNANFKNIQLNNCNFEGNNATYFIDLKAINSQINGCNFTNNDAWGYGYLTNQFGNNSKMSNCIFEDNFIGHDHSRFPVAWFGKLDGDQPTGENISVSKVTFKNNEAIPIRWDALSGNVTDCVFEGNNGTIDNRGNVDRDNGKYDFEVIVYNDTIIGAPDNPYGSGGVVPLDPIGPGGLIPIDGEDGNLFVNITNYGQKQGNIVILLNGTECYNKPETGSPTLINLEDLDPVNVGELNIVVKYVFAEGEYVLYDDTTFIDYYMGIDGFGPWNSRFYPHDVHTFNVTLPDDAKGTLIYNDGIQNHTINYANGKASLTIDASAFKKFNEYNNFTLSLINDPKYPANPKSFSVYVMTKLIFPYFVSEGEKAYAIFDYPDDFNGNLIIYNVTEDNNNGAMLLNVSYHGFGVIPLPDLKLEDNAFYVENNGDYYGIVHTQIIKNSEEISSSIESNTIAVGEDAIVTVSSKLPDCILLVLVDAFEYSYGSSIEPIDLNNTTNVSRISNLAVGDHIIKIIVYHLNEEGSDMIYSNSFLVTVKEKAPTPTPTPTPTVPVKIVAKDYKAYYNKGTYKVTVYGKDGKVAKGVTVVFKINGKKVKTVKTNSKGIATFKIPKKYVPKKYKISATALGKTVTKKLTIKQVLKLKKVKVKKSAKKLVITATLKEGKKALKGKKIIFRFKGKKYTRKTNKKGVAKLVIKKKVLKKLKVGKKVTYKATYLKNTVKRTVKVKK